MKVRTLCSVLLMALWSCAANASLIGDEVVIQTYFPNLASPLGAFGPFTVEAGDGDEQVENAQDISFNVEASSLHIFFDPANGPIQWLDAAFNGWVFEELDWVDDPTGFITDVSVLSTVTGFTDDRVTFSNHSVAVNMQGLTHTGGMIDMYLSVSHDVPEPSTLSLLGFALLGAGMVGRHKRRR